MQLTYTVFRRSGRKYYEIQWINPATGKKETRSTKKTSKRDAERWASDFVDALERIGNPIGRTAWTVFIDAHADEVQPGMAAKTAALYRTSFAAVDRIASPELLNDVDARSLSRFVAELRKAGRSDETIRCYLAHLQTAMKWAVGQRMLQALPAFPALRKKRGRRLAKGRAITGEEFERLLAAVEPEIVAGKASGKGRGPRAAENLPRAVESMQRLLRGLYLGGLRLSEALSLRDGGDDGIRADLSRKRPVLIVVAEDEKGGRDRVLPLTPDFAEFLRSIRPDDPGDRFFRVYGIRREISNAVNISAMISRIGKRAGVKVRSDNGRTKFASAHDLRRSFGTRWAARLDKPRDLQLLMRHSDISTTLAYYVFDDADDLADRIESAVGAGVANTLANTAPNPHATPTHQ